MNIRQIEAFRAVMTTGSVTGGAEFLKISQPAVSRLISDLERNSQLTLFERKGRGLQATPEAWALFEEVKHVFSGVAHLEQTAHNIASFSAGHLRIAALPSLGISFLPKVIKRFRKSYPHITIALQVQNTAAVSAWATRQHFDLGLIGVPPAGAGIDTTIFAEIDSVCILPKGHRLTSNKTISAHDLEGEPFISLASDDVTRAYIDRYFEDLGVRRTLDLETQYAVTICNLVRQGLGVSILSPFAILDGEEMDIVVKPFRPSIKVYYALALPTFRPQSAIAKKFIEVLNICCDEELAKFSKRSRLEV